MSVGTRTTLVMAVLGAVVAAGCAQSPRPPAASAPPTPETLLPGIVSTPGANEGLDWISPDGTIVIFTRADADFTSSSVLIARQSGDGWATAPVGFSTSGYDAGFRLSPSGGALFTSTRAAAGRPRGDWNLWLAPAADGRGAFIFAEPRLLLAPVNSSAAECCGLYGPGGEIYFSSDRSGAWDIFVATPAGDGYVVEPLAGAVNSEYGEWPSAISADGLTLYLSSIRPTGLGGDDIYVSEKREGVWSRPELLPAPVNSASYDDSGGLVGQRFYWSSRRDRTGAPAPVASIFSVDRDAVGARRRGRVP